MRDPAIHQPVPSSPGPAARRSIEPSGGPARSGWLPAPDPRSPERGSTAVSPDPSASGRLLLSSVLQPGSVKVIKLRVSPAPVRCDRRPTTVGQQEADGGERRQRKQSNTERPDTYLLAAEIRAHFHRSIIVHRASARAEGFSARSRDGSHVRDTAAAPGAQRAAPRSRRYRPVGDDVRPLVWFPAYRADRAYPHTIL